MGIPSDKEIAFAIRVCVVAILLVGIAIGGAVAVVITKLMQ